MNHLSDAVKTTRVSNAVAAGTTDVECTSVDMAGFDAVRFVASFGTLTASQVTTVKAQESADNSTFTDITGAASAAFDDGDDNLIAIVDVIRPTKRYVRLVIDRGTANAVVDCVLAEQYQARSEPVTQSASVIELVRKVG